MSGQSVAEGQSLGRPSDEAEVEQLRKREFRRDKHFAAATESWISYSRGAQDLVRLTHEGLERTRKLPDLYLLLEVSDEEMADAEWKAAQAADEIDAGFPTLHAHSLLGLWGALESFVEDVFIAALRSQPRLLLGDAFDKVKLPVSMLAEGHDSLRLRAILTELSRSTSSDLAQGVTRFERLLEPVQLGGMVPSRIKDALYEAQQVRNVWAHRGGVADAWFVERCPHLTYALGSRVNMGEDLFMRLMHATHMYAWVLINRHLDSRGLARIDVACPGFEGASRRSPYCRRQKRRLGSRRCLGRTSASRSAHPGAASGRGLCQEARNSCAEPSGQERGRMRQHRVAGRPASQVVSGHRGRRPGDWSADARAALIAAIVSTLLSSGLWAGLALLSTNHTLEQERIRAYWLKQRTDVEVSDTRRHWKGFTAGSTPSMKSCPALRFTNTTAYLTSFAASSTLQIILTTRR